MSELMVKLKDIRVDERCQQRPTHPDNVKRLREVLAEGGDFIDPVEVFKSKDGTLCLAHGFHRYHAYRLEQVEQIPAVVHPGELDDAVEYSLRPLNAGHGQPETATEKRDRLKTAIELRPDWSDRRIAEHCGAHHATVGKLRKQLDNYPTDPPPSRTGKDGKSYQAAKPAAAEPPPPADDPPPAPHEPTEPDEPLRDQVGQVVPDELVDVFTSGRDELRSLAKQLMAIQKAVTRIKQQPHGAHLAAQATERALKEARKAIEFAVPYAVTPPTVTQKKVAEPGWMSKPFWDSLPDEHKPEQDEIPF